MAAPVLFKGVAAAVLPTWEQAAIRGAAAALGVDPRFLAAIRIAENGGPGREFGVLSVPAPTYWDQLLIAANSVKNAMTRFQAAGGKSPIDPQGRLTEAFVRSFAARWAPPGAANDPNDLNRHWVKNAAGAYSETETA